LIPFAIAAAVGVAAVALVALAVLAGLRPAWAADFRIPKLRPGAQPRRRVKRQERLVYANLTARPSRPDVSPTPHVEPESLSSEPKDDKLELDSADAGERSDAMKIVKSATPDQDEQNESYAQVGEQVASVLAAAHRAADEIRANALEEAERIRDEAEADAASTRDEAGRAAEQTRSETEALRAEADEYSREAREAADRYVATTREQVEDEAANRRAESEQEAREKHRSAEQRARDIETGALERRKAIIEEAERSEARLEQLLGVCRGMTSQLEELLRADQAGGDAADAQDDNGDKEIAEDLRPRRSRTGPATESGSPT
jgi:vacuolar-type H+-ATPase subunit E/Vma4